MQYSNLHSFLSNKLTGRRDNVTSVREGVLFTSLPFVSDEVMPGFEDGQINSVNHLLQSDGLDGNRNFDYHIFYADGAHVSSDCIILLHGLNERSWDKYLPWGYELSRLTGKSVILFPISFHINRSPLAWSNPRLMKQLVEDRQRRIPFTQSLSIANVALSERLDQHPERFVFSGYQAASDLIKLTHTIVSGQHPLFARDTKVDFFGYSIGGFLSQILMLSQARGVLDRSRFFLFCSGSAFQGMNGVSRYIMDSVSYNKLYNFYMKDTDKHKECHESFNHVVHDTAFGVAFQKMMRYTSDVSNSLFDAFRNRMKVISLSRDVVIPTSSINRTLPSGICEELHFDFSYTHENPFPLYSINSSNLMEKVNDSFQSLFEKAAAFFVKPC